MVAEQACLNQEEDCGFDLVFMRRHKIIDAGLYPRRNFRHIIFSTKKIAKWISVGMLVTDLWIEALCLIDESKEISTCTTA